jgi:hypothetical protein
MSGRAADRLAAMVCKQRVALGGLSGDERKLALALVWRGLDGVPLPERDINEALKRQLAGAASFLGTDHVELRRWLVDPEPWAAACRTERDDARSRRRAAWLASQHPA